MSLPQGLKILEAIVWWKHTPGATREWILQPIMPDLEPLVHSTNLLKIPTHYFIDLHRN